MTVRYVGFSLILVLGGYVQAQAPPARTRAVTEVPTCDLKSPPNADGPTLWRYMQDANRRGDAVQVDCFLQASANKLYPDAVASAAQAYYDTAKKDPQFKAPSVKWAKLSASQGHRLGEYVLGQMYWDGFGVEPDKKKAVQLWRASAAKNSGLAVSKLKELGIPQADTAPNKPGLGRPSNSAPAAKNSTSDAISAEEISRLTRRATEAVNGGNWYNALAEEVAPEFVLNAVLYTINLDVEARRISKTDLVWVRRFRELMDVSTFQKVNKLEELIDKYRDDCGPIGPMPDACEMR